MKSLLNWLGVLGLTVVLTSCGGSDKHKGNLVEIARDNGYNALQVAVIKADVAGTLTASDANLTLFAPSDAAFATLASQLGFADAGAMVNALSASDLRKLLSYHLVPGTKYAADLKTAGAALSTAYSFDGAAAKLALDTSTGVALTDADLATARVTVADRRANNGILHGVD